MLYKDKKIFERRYIFFRLFSLRAKSCILAKMSYLCRVKICKNTMSNTEILVCAHRDSLVPNVEPYMPIHVGKSLSDKELGCVTDNTGDNISEKNPHYCELTALCWAWKNLNGDTQWVGLNHYRRYFWFGAPSTYRQIYKHIDPADFDRYIAQTPTDMSAFMGDCDVVLPKLVHYNTSIQETLNQVVSVEDQTIFNAVLLAIHPEYEGSMERYLERTNKISHFNMFIARREIFDKFCAWIFPVLFEVEKYVALGSYFNQRRLYGYLSEFYMGLFFYHNGYKIKRLPVIFVDTVSQPGRTDIGNTGSLKYFIETARKDVSFFIARGAIRDHKFAINPFIANNLKMQDGITLPQVGSLTHLRVNEKST